MENQKDWKTNIVFPSPSVLDASKEDLLYILGLHLARHLGRPNQTKQLATEI